MSAPALRPFGVVATGLVAAALAAAAGQAGASSHREAPFIASQPQVDATDFYMFRSYEPGRDGYLTLIANYLPPRDPSAGPTTSKLTPNAAHEFTAPTGATAAHTVLSRFRIADAVLHNLPTIAA